jgi:uncharacterized protein (TIGR04141 family)
MPKITPGTNKPKVRRSDFSIFLLKEDFTEPANFLRGGDIDEAQVTYHGKKIGTLYTKSKPVTKPGWMKNLAGATITPDPQLKSAFSSAVLVVHGKDRVFALTYGYGRSMLVEDAWEQDFGLKVVLNSIDPKKIRQIERSSFDSLLQNTSAQSVREAAVDEFGLDVEQDVIRSLRGASKISGLGDQIRGRDSLHLHLASELDSLHSLLDQTIAEYSKKEYRKVFPFIDKMAEIRSPEHIAKLDKMLIKRVTENAPEKIWMALPVVIQWYDGSYLRYSSDQQKEPRQDIFLAEYKATLPPDVTMTIEMLKKHRISLFGADGQDIESWRVYRCIYCEVESGKSRFILNNGKWYQVDQDYVNEIQKFYESIPESKVNLPLYNHKSEGDYNKFAAAETSFGLMDKEIISIPNRGRVQVEFCDLYDRSGRMIHVKRYSGSSELSHLFAQGVVSGEMFLDDRKFRELVNEKLTNKDKLGSTDSQPDAKKYEIVFAVISSSTKAGRKDIPFFSKVNLRSAAQRLRGRGYRVSLADIRHA